MHIRRVAGVLAIGSLGLLAGCGWHQVGGGGTQASAVAAPATRPELSPGMVKQVQADLQRDGLYHGNIDGIWGGDTVRAVMEYQQRNRLRPTGDLDPQTLAALHVVHGNGSYAGTAQPGQGAPAAVGTMPSEGTMPAPPANPSNVPPPPSQTQ